MAAQAAPSGRHYVFNIPGQPLAAALQAYARVTGESVFFDGDLAAGRLSPGVSGEFSAGAALGHLLSGTRLEAVYTRAGMLTLRDAAPRAPAPDARQPEADLPAHVARKVQSALERSLCGSAATRPGSYRALLQLDVDKAGQVQHVSMVTSSGSSPRDRAIQAALRGARIGSEAAAEGGRYLVLLEPSRPDVCGSRAVASHGR